MDPLFWAFVGTAALLTLTPGADTALVVRTAAGEGPRAGVATVLGIHTGLLVHAMASALGISALLQTSPVAFAVVKWAGAGYLVWLGVRGLMVRHDEPSQSVAGPQFQLAAQANAGPVAFPRPSIPAPTLFARGLLTNVSNPKVALFYLTLLPQFVRPTDGALSRSVLLAIVHILLGVIWLSLVAYGVGRLRALVARPSFRRRLEAATSVALIALGVRLALAER